MDRLFEIHPNASYVLFKDVTLREGYTDEAGAGIQNWNKGTTRLESVMIKDSLSSKVGGGINHDEPAEYPWLVQPTTPPRAGRLEIIDSTFKGNASGGGGAAINNSGAGTVIIDGSQIVDNPGLMIPDPTQAPEPGGEVELVPAPGVYEPDSPAIMNEAQFDVEGTIKITDSTIARNFAHHDGAGLMQRRQRRDRARADDGDEEPDDRGRRRHLPRRRQRHDQGLARSPRTSRSAATAAVSTARARRARSGCAARSRSPTR